MKLPLLLLAGLGATHFYGPTLGARLFNHPLFVVPPSPRRYCELAIYLGQHFGIHSNSQVALKATIVAKAKMQQVSTFKEAHAISDAALKAYGGLRSGVIKTNVESSIENTAHVTRNDDTVVVELAGFGPLGQANLVSKAIVRELSEGARSVILDLRNTHGGDLTNMLAAVSPLLPDGVTFSYRNRENHLFPVSIVDGIIRDTEGSASIDVKQKFNVPVAILICENTCDTGEAIALAFHGQPNVRMFGSPTSGQTCANLDFPMPDNTSLKITINAIITRNGVEFCGEPIEPDEDFDNPLDAALTWVNSMQ